MNTVALPAFPTNEAVWREIAYFLCAQASGCHFVSIGKRGAVRQGVELARTAGAPRSAPHGNHGDNTFEVVT